MPRKGASIVAKKSASHSRRIVLRDEYTVARNMEFAAGVRVKDAVAVQQVICFPAGIRNNRSDRRVVQVHELHLKRRTFPWSSDAQGSDCQELQQGSNSHSELLLRSFIKKCMILASDEGLAGPAGSTEKRINDREGENERKRAAENHLQECQSNYTCVSAITLPQVPEHLLLRHRVSRVSRHCSTCGKGIAGVTL